jgi:predicted transcriptional regulator
LKYRSRFDIVVVMLQSSVSGATKTKMMYEAFLSHSQVEEYLGFLLERGLVTLLPDKKHYHPTEKGLRFIEMYGEIQDAVSLGTQPGAAPGPPVVVEVGKFAQPSQGSSKKDPES